MPKYYIKAAPQFVLVDISILLFQRPSFSYCKRFCNH